MEEMTSFHCEHGKNEATDIEDMADMIELHAPPCDESKILMWNQMDRWSLYDNGGC